MKDYSKMDEFDLLEMLPPAMPWKLKALRIDLLKRAMRGNAVDNNRFTRLMAKVGEVDTFLTGIRSRRMFWIAMISLAVTAVMAGADLYLRLRCP